jgi:hypothetical protein
MEVLFEIAVFDSIPESNANTVMDYAFNGIGQVFWENWATLEATPYGQSKHLVTLMAQTQKILSVEVYIDREVSEEYIQTLVNQGLYHGAHDLGEVLGEYVASSIITSVTNMWDATTRAFDSVINHVADAIQTARRKLSS